MSGAPDEPGPEVVGRGEGQKIRSEK